AQAMAELEVMRSNCARRAGLLRLFRRYRNQDSRNAQHFYLAGDDDYYAMTERATGSQNSPVGFRAQNQTSHFGGGAFIEVAKVLGVSHKAQVRVAQPGYDSFVSQFAQAINGEDTVDILVGVSMIKVLVSYHEVGTLYLARDDPPAVVPIDIKRLLITQMNASGGNQSKNALDRKSVV